ncbi:MAG: VWA domain-containing protein [Blastocatellia bacterium]|jgi:Ca-activated chloride channel family protein
MKLGLIHLLVFLSGLTGLAQDRPLTLKLDTDVVTVDIVATDQKGDYVRDLRREELQLFEDGQIRSFDLFAVNSERMLSRPLAVVFALDLSGSLKPDETVTLRESALRFLELVRGESVFAALTFNHEVKVRQEFTRDANRLVKAFTRNVRFEGSTRIYDAIDRGVRMLEKSAPRIIGNRPVRRALIVISDGFDSASVIDRREMVRRAISAGVTVYSITLPSYILSATRRRDRVLTPLDATRVVSSTGGSDYPADNNDFSPVFSSLAEEIRSTYAIAYYPDSRDGRDHRLEVRTTRPGVVLRLSRSTYRSPGAEPAR